MSQVAARTARGCTPRLCSGCATWGHTSLFHSRATVSLWFRAGCPRVVFLWWLLDDVCFWKDCTRRWLTRSPSSHGFLKAAQAFNGQAHAENLPQMASDCWTGWTALHLAAAHGFEEVGPRIEIALRAHAVTLVLVSQFDHGRSVMLCYLIHGSLSLQRRTGSDKCPRGILHFGRTALAGMLCMQLQRPPGGTAIDGLLVSW